MIVFSCICTRAWLIIIVYIEIRKFYFKEGKKGAELHTWQWHTSIYWWNNHRLTATCDIVGLFGSSNDFCIF